jgi:hypothetical protein
MLVAESLGGIPQIPVQDTPVSVINDQLEIVLGYYPLVGIAPSCWNNPRAS